MCAVLPCRDISHTPFFVEGQRLGKTSIQEILEELLQPDLRFRSAKLISAGGTPCSLLLVQPEQGFPSACSQTHAMKNQRRAEEVESSRLVQFLLQSSEAFLGPCMFVEHMDTRILSMPLTCAQEHLQIHAYRQGGLGCEDARQREALCAGGSGRSQRDALTAAAAGSAGTAQVFWRWRGGFAPAGGPEEHPEDHQGRCLLYISAQALHTPQSTLLEESRLAALLCLWSSQGTLACKANLLLAQSIFIFWQDGEGEKQKSYLARCRLPCPVTDDMLQQLTAMKDIVLKQTTPTRVEQRRAMLVVLLLSKLQYIICS